MVRSEEMIDVNLLGIENEGIGDHSVQYNRVYWECYKHRSNEVTSTLHRLFDLACLTIGRSVRLNLHDNRSTGQNKKCSPWVLVLQVTGECPKENNWNSMQVGNSNFCPMGGFGSTDSHACKGVSVMGTLDTLTEIEWSAHQNRAVLFSAVSSVVTRVCLGAVFIFQESKKLFHCK